MIEQALYEHLISQPSLTSYLTTYNSIPAVFNQEAPADRDGLWGSGPQYGRIVFAVDMQGDPARTMGGLLAVDIQCKENEQFPEVLEPIVRSLIHGWFFSNGIFTVEAQWRNSSYFTEPTEHVTGCTVSFDLLGFPIITTDTPDVIARINEWTHDTFDGLHVINYDTLPEAAWRPEGDDAAIYWRVVTDSPAQWIPDTNATIWRTATVRAHIFSQNIAAAATLARNVTTKLHAVKRLTKSGESQIMTNRQNTVDFGADPLRTGQVTVQATYGIVVYESNSETIDNINRDYEID